MYYVQYLYVHMYVLMCVCMYSWVNACRARRSAALLLRCWRFVLRCLFKTVKSAIVLVVVPADFD